MQNVLKNKYIFLPEMYHHNVLSPNKPKQELATKTIEGGKGIKPYEHYYKM
jgi:hypothetical protein